MYSRKFLISFCLIAAFYLPLAAQVKFSTVIDEKEIGKGAYLQVQYIVENAASVESLKPPAFENFTIVSGPMQQNGMSIINGAVSKYEGVTYVLKPSHTGNFIIAGATALVNGKQLRSNSVAVVVTNTAPRSSSPPTNPFFGLSMPEETPEVNEEYILRKGESAVDKIKNNLLVKLDVSKTTCYVGEPVVATYKLYSRVRSESKVTKRPSLSQFSVYDMVQPEANNPAVEKLNGKLYTTHTIRKVQLYALQDGSFVLDPIEVDNTVSFLRLEGNGGKTSMQQLLDDYMNGVSDGKLEQQQVSIASKPVTITVKPLPMAGKPVSFDGAVGKFTLSALVPKAQIATGETAVLQITLRGQGNLNMINAPPVQWPQDIERYDPTVKENLDKTVTPISGSKLFEYSFTAKNAGRLIIPSVTFSYFDPANGTYKTIATDAITLDISKPTQKPIPANSALTENSGQPVGGRWQKLWWMLPVLAIALLALFFNRKKTTPSKDAVATIAPARLPEQERKVPADPFEAARYALEAVNSQLFYKEIARATWLMVAEKFNLTASQRNKPVVMRLLEQANASTETATILESVLNDCALALYTPVHTENDMRLTLDKAERLKELFA
ncbi:MAG: BatD family protein [Bacteroidota bacterium]